MTDDAELVFARGVVQGTRDTTRAMSGLLTLAASRALAEAQVAQDAGNAERAATLWRHHDVLSFLNQYAIATGRGDIDRANLIYQRLIDSRETQK